MLILVNRQIVTDLLRNASPVACIGSNFFNTFEEH